MNAARAPIITQIRKTDVRCNRRGGRDVHAHVDCVSGVDVPTSPSVTHGRGSSGGRFGLEAERSMQTRSCNAAGFGGRKPPTATTSPTSWNAGREVRHPRPGIASSLMMTGPGVRGRADERSCGSPANKRMHLPKGRVPCWPSDR
jgi:hypothetical protein